MARYAAKRGFKWHKGERCYYHADGRWIQRAEKPFHWVEMTADGHPTLRFWVQEQTLAEGIELPAEIWSLLRTEPRSATLLIKDGVESAVAFTGGELVELQADKQISLYPSRYRIVEAEPR
jgi:hypothetical protein